MVRFSEIALAGIEEVTDSADQAQALRHSISLHLSHEEAAQKSIRLSEPADRLLYLFTLWKVRITWELKDDGVLVWSVSKLRKW